MTLRLALNGAGRVGTTLIRTVFTFPKFTDVDVVAINDIAMTAEDIAYQIRHDSSRGDFPAEVVGRGDTLTVDGHTIRVTSHGDPQDAPWKEEGVYGVIEATGALRDERARGHLAAGAEKVIVTASAADVDAVLVVGVNDHLYDPTSHHVISPASCGVNALAVMAKVLDDRFGLREVDTHVDLALQAWQRTQDGVDRARHSRRLGRAGGMSIIPHHGVDGDLLQHALPQLGQIAHRFVCTPVPLGSAADLHGQLLIRASVDEVNAALATAAAGYLAGIIDITDDDPVSRHAVGRPVSCLVDLTATRIVRDGRVQVAGFFDGELLMAARVLDLVQLTAGPRPPAASTAAAAA